MAIALSSDSLDPRIRDAGVLVNLLDAAGGTLTVNEAWFQNPLGDKNIGGVSSRPQALLNLLADIIGDPAPDPPTADLDWYPIKHNGENTGLNVVVSKPGSEPALMALGFLAEQKSTGPPGITAAAYFLFPLFALSKTAPWQFVLGQAGHPAQAGGVVKTSESFEAGGKPYQTLQVVGSFYFDGTAPGFAVNLLDGTGHLVAGFTNIQSLLDSHVTDWINVVLAVKPVADWLDTKIGSSTTESIGSVLVAAGLLNAAAPPSTVHTVADLNQFLSQSPSAVAEHLILEALKILATQQDPLVTVGNGGIWVVKKDEPDYYGIRVCLPDVGKPATKDSTEGAAPAEAEPTGATPPADGIAKNEKNQPQLVLQVGKWFTGEESGSSWMKRAGKSTFPGPALPEPGAYVYLLENDNDTLSFKPRLELVSIGLDFVGGNGSALIDVKGVQLGGFEPRMFLAMDLTEGGPEHVQWGGGIRLDWLGFPLAGGFDGVTGDNPVASNLLASGESAPGKGGDAATGKTDAVNPSFSVSASYVDSLNVQLYGPDDSETDRVWFPIQRSFGPLNCKKLGVGWKEPELSLLFEGGVALGPLDLEVMGLSVGLDISHPTDLSKYSLGLEGLSLDFKAGIIEISGGFLENRDVDPVAYDGQARVKAGPFGLSAIGSYTTIKDTGETSLFVFALLDFPLGGPPFFYITGLAGGFGYNRSLKTPGMDEVHSFPLIAALSDPSAIGGKDATAAAALRALDTWIPPMRGQNWIAAGIKFTTFELINSNALIVVSFGTYLEIDVLGTSTIKLPQAGPAFAYAELDLEVVIAPDEGVFKASLILSAESFVLDPKCKLTGGFAFYVWFGPNEHAGDFVITLGGYHPAFTPPRWYPAIPRLGFDWPVAAELTIKGGAYFALTPACVMAGGRLEVLFQAGAVKAWCIAHADFIIFWKPFFFDAGIGVSLGVSVTFVLFGATVTLALELGAEVELWGPPTGGLMHISLFIISFTIRFGEDKPSLLPTLSWDEFNKTLPQGGGNSVMAGTLAAPDDKTTVVSISIANGLLTQTGTGDDLTWFVRPDEFEWFTKTTIPATRAVVGAPESNAEPPVVATTQLGVRPMGIRTIDDGSHTIDISGPAEVSMAAFDYDLDLGSTPEAIWGPPVFLRDLKPTANVIPNCIVGVAGIRLKPHAALVGPPPIDVATAFTFVVIDQTTDPGGNVRVQEWLPISTAFVPPASGGPVTGTLESVQATVEETKGARSNMFSTLAGLGMNAGADGDLTAFAANPGAGLGGAPMAGSPVVRP